MKKVLSLVLALALVLGSFAPAFAAENPYAEQGALLEDLNVFLGADADVKGDVDLDKEVTRAELFILISRLIENGVEKEETYAIMGAAMFDDVEQTDWFAAAAGWAYAKGLTKGVGDNNFGPTGTVDLQQVQTLLLRALGHTGDDVWANAAELAATAGIMGDIEDTNMTKGLLAALTVNTLKAENTDGVVLATKLGHDSILEEEEPVVETLGVASIVSNYSRSQFVVNFDKAVDADTVVASAAAAADDTVKVYNGSSLVNLVINLNDAGTELNIQLPSSYAQETELKLVIDGVATETDLTLENYEQTFKIKDIVNPEVKSIEMTSSKTFDITFSEAITQTSGVSKVWDNITVNGNKAVGQFDVNTSNANVWTFTLNSKLAVGSHTITVKGFTDATGFGIADFTGTVAVSEDSVAPAIASIEVLAKDLIQVVFTEPVVTTAGSLAIGSDNYAMNAPAVTKVDSKTYKVALNTDLDAASTYGEVLTYTSITDIEGNASSSDGTDFEFAAPVDKEKPTATVELKAGNDLTVTFSELVEGADTPANYTLYDKDDNLVETADVADLTEDTANKVYTIDFDTLDGIDPAAYTLKISGITDKSVIGNSMAAFSYSFTALDDNAPSVVGSPTIVATDVVRITFSEAMDTATLTDASNYLYESTFLKDVTGYAITVASDAKSVDLTIPGVASAENIRLFDIKDASGKRIVAGDFNTDLAIANPATFTHADLTINATGLRTLEVVAGGGHVFSTVDPNAFKVLEGGSLSTTHYITGAVIDSEDSTKAVLTFNADIDADGTIGGSAITIYVEGTTVTNTFGEELVVAQGNAVSVNDVIVPVATEIADSGNKTTFNITLSEELADTLNGPIVTGEFLAFVDGALDNTATFAYDSTTDVLSVTLSGAASVDEVVNVKFYPTASTTIVDKATTPNALKAFDLSVTVE